MFLNIQIDLLILKTYDGQFTLTELNFNPSLVAALPLVPWEIKTKSSAYIKI